MQAAQTHAAHTHHTHSWKVTTNNVTKVKINLSSQYDGAHSCNYPQQKMKETAVQQKQLSWTQNH